MWVQRVFIAITGIAAILTSYAYGDDQKWIFLRKEFYSTYKDGKPEYFNLYYDPSSIRKGKNFLKDKVFISVLLDESNVSYFNHLSQTQLLEVDCGARTIYRKAEHYYKEHMGLGQEIEAGMTEGGGPVAKGSWWDNVYDAVCG